MKRFLSSFIRRVPPLPKDRLPTPARGRRGFSILTVLLSLTLLATILAGFAGVVQNRTARVAREVQAARGERSAESGVAIAVAILLDNAALPERSRAAADGTPFACSLPDGTTLVIAMQNVAGRIDLNTASPPLIGGLLNGLMDADAADALRSAILSRRNGDGFRLVQELAQLPGVSRALYTTLEPDITVSSTRSTLHRRATRSELRARLARAGLAEDQAFSAPPNGTTFAISVEAVTAPTRGYRVDTTVEIRPGRLPAYHALTWTGHVMTPGTNDQPTLLSNLASTGTSACTSS